MSRMIQCDGCKSLAHDDCTAREYGFREIWIDQRQRFHVCGRCYDSMMRKIFHMRYDDNERQYVEED